MIKCAKIKCAIGCYASTYIVLVKIIFTGKKFKCYKWSEADLKLIRKGIYKVDKGLGGKYTVMPNSMEMQRLVCLQNDFVFTGDGSSKAPGCGSCWCCQPNNLGKSGCFERVYPDGEGY